MFTAGHLPELIIILVLGLIILGPGKLPQVGGAVGKTIREFRKASTESDAEAPVQEDEKAATPVATVVTAAPKTPVATVVTPPPAAPPATTTAPADGVTVVPTTVSTPTKTEA